MRYRAILRRVLADQTGATYVDEALRPATEADQNADFVTAFADKIPDTYGAPKRERAPARSEQLARFVIPAKAGIQISGRPRRRGAGFPRSQE